MELTLYARAPVIQLPKAAHRRQPHSAYRANRSAGRTLRSQDRRTLAAGGFYDLGQDVNVDACLRPGATYEASIGGHKMTFQIDAKAKIRPGADRQPPAALPMS